MATPVGNDPIEFDGIVMRWSDELPQGIYARYDRDGNIIDMARIGINVPPARPIASVTLNRADYEVVKISYRREDVRKLNARRARRYGSVRLPH